MYYIQVCNNTQDFSQQNMFVCIIFLGLFDMRPFIVLSKLFHLFHAQTIWHIGKTESHRHLKTLNSVCSASESSSYEDYMSRLMTKPTKWHVHPAKTQISLGIRPVWSESSLCAQWVAKGSSFLHADSEDFDQTGRMPRMIWVFAGRTGHFVGFVMRRLIWQFTYFQQYFSHIILLVFKLISRDTEKYEVWTVKSELWSLKSEQWTVKCELCSVKCELWTVKCGLWSLRYEVWSLNYEVWSLKREVWTVNWSDRVAERLAHPTSDRGVSGSNPSGREIRS